MTWGSRATCFPSAHKENLQQIALGRNLATLIFENVAGFSYGI